MVSVSICSKKPHLDDGDSDATWHSTKVGEIFYTDGISRKEKFRVSLADISIY